MHSRAEAVAAGGTASGRFRWDLQKGSVHRLDEALLPTVRALTRHALFGFEVSSCVGDDRPVVVP